MSKRSILARTALTTAAAAMTLSTLLGAPGVAAAQSDGAVNVPIPPRSDATAPPPPSEAPPPAQQGGAYQPPAPSSQQYSQNAYQDYQRQLAEYRARRAEWVRQNCEAKKAGSAVAGAVFGGIAGALLGSALGGRGYRGTDAAIGGGLGAVTGAAIGASAAGACPDGYALRADYAPLPPPPPPPRGYYYYPPPPVVYGPPPPVVYYGPPAYYGWGFYYGPRWRRW